MTLKLPHDAGTMTKKKTFEHSLGLRRVRPMKGSMYLLRIWIWRRPRISLESLGFIWPVLRSWMSIPHSAIYRLQSQTCCRISQSLAQKRRKRMPSGFPAPIRWLLNVSLLNQAWLQNALENAAPDPSAFGKNDRDTGGHTADLRHVRVDLQAIDLRFELSPQSWLLVVGDLFTGHENEDTNHLAAGHHAGPGGLRRSRDNKPA